MLENIFNDEKYFIDALAYVMIFSAFVTVILLCSKFDAPYGRYTSSSWGSLVPGKLAWFLQELPSFLVPSFLIYKEGVDNIAITNKILLLMFLVHYFQRTFIFPALIRGGKPTPFIPFIMALVFCIWNGYMQGRSLTHFSAYTANWLSSTQFRVGVILFVVGMLINLHSDHVLRNLRKPGETGYKIPTGGLFDYVTGANFLGEIIEWAGFACACWSLQALAFAVFTALNIGPRSMSHHQWYLKKFVDYPRSRKILIPFLF